MKGFAWRWLDLASIGLVAFAALAAKALPSGWLSDALGALLVLVLPTAAITAAAFPKRSVDRPALLERCVLGAGAGIAVVVFGALLLNSSPWGVRADGWRIYLGCVVIVALGVAAWRRIYQPHAPQARAWWQSTSLPLPTRREAALFGSAAIVLGLALGLGRVGAPEQTSDSFTQLWASRTGTTAVQVLDVGVRNLEGKPARYRLVVLAGSSQIDEVPNIDLQPQETWHGHFDLPPATDRQPVEALLYRLDAPDRIYRQVRSAPLVGP